MRRVPDGMNILIEVKKLRSDSKTETMESRAMDAIAQVEEKRYTHGLDGTNLLYGIASLERGWSSVERGSPPRYE